MTVVEPPDSAGANPAPLAMGPPEGAFPVEGGHDFLVALNDEDDDANKENDHEEDIPLESPPEESDVVANEIIQNSTPTTDLEKALTAALERKGVHIQRLMDEINKLRAFISKRKQTYKRKRKDDGAPTRALSGTPRHRPILSYPSALDMSPHARSLRCPCSVQHVHQGTVRGIGEAERGRSQVGRCRCCAEAGPPGQFGHQDGERVEGPPCRGQSQVRGKVSTHGRIHSGYVFVHSG